MLNCLDAIVTEMMILKLHPTVRYSEQAVCTGSSPLARGSKPLAVKAPV
jgi:hypothetical protein